MVIWPLAQKPSKTIKGLKLEKTEIGTQENGKETSLGEDIYTYTYTFTYTNTFTYIYTFTYIHTFTYSYTYSYITCLSFNVYFQHT